jgi:hypothetical protein
MAAFAAATVCCAQPKQDFGPHLHWDGVLSGPTVISVQAFTVDVRGSTPDAVGDYRYHMSQPLSDSFDQDVALKVRGGGRIRVTQQPRKANQYVAILQVDTSKTTQVSFDLLYRLYPRSWFDAPNEWWTPRDVVRWHSRGDGRITVVCRKRRCSATQEEQARPIDRFDFSPSLPAEESLVNLTEVQMPGLAGILPQAVGNDHGGVRIIEQPSRRNDYTVRILLDLTGLGNYAFTINWLPSHRSAITP